ncbi:phage tail assembly protein [Gracilibacillus xinjiangensis]|uniref:Phage tail assembly protein n=1 Tax=Gracilibacillus xinjiangensis TaxID=1193282 RepID=A0ABV8WXK5_9BACI
MRDYVVEFKNPYTFEGEEFSKIDLSGLENLSTKDLIEADKQFNTSGQMALMNEMTTGYSCIVASKATGKPVEFFEGLPAGEGLKLKNTVMGFLNA